MEKDKQQQRNVHEALEYIKQQINDKGSVETYAYLQTRLNHWAEEEVTIAVTGMSGTGKSTFINVIRGVKGGEPCYAEQNRVDTTQHPTYYQYPKNEKIRFCDLPGVGKTQFQREGYCKEMHLEQYDLFLIFLLWNMMADDKWLAETLCQMNKPFCFVRSKIDEDKYCAPKDGIKRDEVIEIIRGKIVTRIESNEILKRCLNLFLISSYDKNLGEWEEFVSFIWKNLSGGKREAILYALPNITADIIEKKYSQLKTRVEWVTAGTSLISAVPVQALDVLFNIAIVIFEIIHYIDVLGLRHVGIDKLDGFNASKLNCQTKLDPNINMGKLIVIGLGKARAVLSIMVAESINDVAMPLVGSAASALTTAHIVYKYLNTVLDELKEDAYLIYGHIAKIDNEKLFRSEILT